MDLFQIVILSVVEGITEFLPVSSTGHLILTTKILSLPQSELLKTFMITIQSGAMLAVVNIYWRKFKDNPNLILKAIIGLFPTLVIGALIYPFFKSTLLESPMIVAGSLVAGGIAIILIERLLKRSKAKEEKSEIDSLTYRQAFLTGLTQTLAIIPGVSRSAASIFGGMTFGLGRKTATEFSFILALPTIFAATSYDLIQTGPSFSNNELMLLLLGIFISYIVALFVIKWLLNFVSNYSFELFGWYRIAFGLVFFLLFFSSQ